jgi:Heat shock transcription factor
MDDLDLTFLGVTITPSCSNEDIDPRDGHSRESQRRTRSINKDTAAISGGGGGKRKNRITKKDRHVIQHDYHDHASDPIDFDDYMRDMSDNQPYDKKKGGVGTPFPLKLHELLERAEVENLTDIISWQPHGRAFVVHQPKKFVSGLMPRFFRQTKLTSFQRQLNLYGFNRLTKGEECFSKQYHRPISINPSIHQSIHSSFYSSFCIPMTTG